MKLYYASGACSLSPHIALREAGLPFSLEVVDFMNGKKVPDGRLLSEINPKGYVPALELDDGSILTEGAVIVQWIADHVPASKLAPPNGTMERVRLQEWLHFIGSEIHKGMSPLYGKISNDEYKAFVKERVAGRFAFAEKSLEGKQFLVGDTFTVADGYLFYVLRAWQRTHKQTPSPALSAWYARIAARPSVAAAFAAERIEA